MPGAQLPIRDAARPRWSGGAPTDGQVGPVGRGIYSAPNRAPGESVYWFGRRPGHHHPVPVGVFEHFSLEMELTSVIPSVPFFVRRGVVAVVIASVATSATALPATAQAPSAPVQAPAPIAPMAVSTQPTAPVGPVRRISIDEAVTMALEQNVSLQVAKMTPGISELDVVQAYGTWLPALTGQFRFQSLEQPVATILQSGADNFAQDQVVGNFGVEQFLPTGGSYSLGYQASRTKNNNQFATLNPNTQGNLTFSFSQPLLQNRSIDSTRQQILISKNNFAISDMQFRNTVVSTVRDVKNAYWDLVVAQSALVVQRQTLELSLQTLGDNRKRVEVGTMAPIDIVQAEAEVAANEEVVIIAEQTVAQAQDRLRALILDPRTAEFWTTTFEPADPPSLATSPVDVDAAVQKAIANRLDLQQARKTLETNDIRIKFFKNQVLPDISANIDYGLAGLGGTVINREGGGGIDPGQPISTTSIPYSEVLRDVFGFAYPTWTASVNFRYPLGRNGNRVNLERQQFQNEQNLLQLRDLERQVVQQVRDLARQVNTNLRRVSSTQAARALAERRLEAEQKKFGVGLSTTFNVLQAQRDLAAARNNEQRAILDFEKSRVDFEAAQEASISGAGAGSLTLGGATGQGTGSTGTTTRVTQGAGTNQNGRDASRAPASGTGRDRSPRRPTADRSASGPCLPAHSGIRGIRGISLCFPRAAADLGDPHHEGRCRARRAGPAVRGVGGGAHRGGRRQQRRHGRARDAPRDPRRDARVVRVRRPEEPRRVAGQPRLGAVARRRRSHHRRAARADRRPGTHARTRRPSGCRA